MKPRFRNEFTPDIKFRGIQYIIDTADQDIDNDDPDYELYKKYDDFIHNTLDFSTVWVINMSQNQVYDKSDAFIHVRGVTSHKRMEITVTDNGRGIDPESMERIFDKFYQARDQTRKKPKGTGLGLSITKKIVELHGGQIDVESEWGSGSRFKLIFPGDGNEENLSERKK